jgi:LmbE family N-acetylglucosaminyl deacetylase
LFSPNYYVDISPFLERKIEAMELYETERREWPHPRSPEAVNVMAKKRGMEVNLNAAEAFMILRQRW